MSLSSGFYDSINHDRKYSSIDFTSIFDGIIKDGVFMDIGDRFKVSPGASGYVSIGTGRAWFDHSWTKNDAPMSLQLLPSNVTWDRIDALVLETNRNDAVRANSFKWVQGAASSNPQKPTALQSEYVNQHIIAYVRIKANSSSVSGSDIENAVGTSVCPFVTAPLKAMTIDQIVSQWNTQFNEWFQELQNVLSGDVAGNLLVKIDQVEANHECIEVKFTYNGWQEYNWGDNHYWYQEVYTPGVQTTYNYEAPWLKKSGTQSTDVKLQDAFDIMNRGFFYNSYANYIGCRVYEKPMSVDVTLVFRRSSK